MQRVILAALVSLAAPITAQATLMSISNETLPPGTTTATCIQRGGAAFAAVGMEALTSTSAAAWGQRDGERIFTIYCVSERQTAIIVGAGPNGQEVGPDVSALASAFRAAIAPAPAPQRPVK